MEITEENVLNQGRPSCLQIAGWEGFFSHGSIETSSCLSSLHSGIRKLPQNSLHTGILVFFPLKNSIFDPLQKISHWNRETERHTVWETERDGGATARAKPVPFSPPFSCSFPSYQERGPALLAGAGVNQDYYAYLFTLQHFFLLKAIWDEDHFFLRAGPVLPHLPCLTWPCFACCGEENMKKTLKPAWLNRLNKCSQASQIHTNPHGRCDHTKHMWTQR